MPRDMERLQKRVAVMDCQIQELFAVIEALNNRINRLSENPNA